MSLTVLQKGQCWTDAQCGAGSKCENAMGCGCKALCKAADKPGVCSKPSNLGKTCTVGVGAPTIDCGKGNYCKLPVASCKGSGTCAAKPVMCTKEFKQVCGCNSTSYGNKCMARSAGQNIKATGACVAKG
ncbi:MAG TPA: hypothetical protein EYP98_06075, partial [Planctomycetes bacterium]|nr:hypothetical protein [Planctomycetota bacterium]